MAPSIPVRMVSIPQPSYWGCEWLCPDHQQLWGSRRWQTCRTTCSHSEEALTRYHSIGHTSVQYTPHCHWYWYCNCHWLLLPRRDCCGLGLSSGNTTFHTTCCFVFSTSIWEVFVAHSGGVSGIEKNLSLVMAVVKSAFTRNSSASEYFDF